MRRMIVYWPRIEYLIKEFGGYFFSKNTTTRKRWNLIKTIWNWKIRKYLLVDSYPIMSVLCSGPICNLRCVLCPSGQQKSGRSVGFLSRNVVERVIKELGPYLFHIELFNWGEPLLNRNIFKYIRMIKASNIEASLSTNLNVFNEEICEEIVNSGLDLLIISLHGCSQDSLDKFQKGSNFKNVMLNVKKIIKHRKLKGVKHPKLQWRFIVNIFNENELSLAHKISKEVGFDIFEPSPTRCDMGKELLMDEKAQFLNVKPYLPKNEKYSKYNSFKQKKKLTRRNDCYWLWCFNTINWNGSVSPCCAVWDEIFDFGNILETPFKEIWNGKKYQLARKILKSNENIEAPGIICSICKKNNAILF